MPTCRHMWSVNTHSLANAKASTATATGWVPAADRQASRQLSLPAPALAPAAAAAASCCHCAAADACSAHARSIAGLSTPALLPLLHSAALGFQICLGLFRVALRLLNELVGSAQLYTTLCCSGLKLVPGPVRGEQSQQYHIEMLLLIQAQQMAALKLSSLMSSFWLITPN